MWRDIEYGFRQTRQRKLFSAIVMLLVAIGIGSTTLIFSFVNTLLLKPLPVQDPQNLYLLERNYPQQVSPDTSFSYRQYDSLRARSDLFSDVIGEEVFDEGNLVPLGESRAVRLVMPQIVSPNYFSSLGVRAFLGRVLTEADARATSDIAVVLSYQFWESQFDRDPAVIGRRLRLKKFPFLIVGVLRREFHSIDIERAPDLRMPISAARILTGHGVTDVVEVSRGASGLGFELLVRLRPGVPPRAAAKAIEADSREVDRREVAELNARRQQPESKQMIDEWLRELKSSWMALEPVGQGVSHLRAQFGLALKLLLGAVAFLFGGVCANIAGLLLAKSEERRREMALRLSLGASRWRILRQALAENILLAVPGALLGIAIADLLSPFLVLLLPAARDMAQYVSPRIVNVAPDERVLLFATALCAVCVLIFGLVPGFLRTRPDLNSELKGNRGRGTMHIPGIGLIGVQVTLSIVLMAAAGLMLRTFWNLEHLNPGFDRAHIIGFTVDTSHAGYSDTQTATLMRRLEEMVRALPGVRAVAYSGRGLMRGAGLKATVAPQGVVLPRTTYLNTSVNYVSPGYFEATGTPLLAGRDLRLSDRDHKPAPVVVNRALAELLFPGQNPIGKFLVLGTDGTKPPRAVIVGVAGMAKYRSMREPSPPTWYGLLTERDGQPVTLYVRTYGEPERIIRSVTSVLRSLDPTVPIMEAGTLEQEVQNSMWQERLVALLSLFFAVTALTLSTLGLYGALSYSVARRTRELGIRIAVGARVRHIVQTVCARTLRPVGIGLVAGLAICALVLRVTRHLLYGIEPLDALSLCAAVMIVLLCAAVAAAVPSRRAVTTDPLSALRDE
ncbi:MAG: ABC transporter permease [Acidobacteriaceae bacterium]|nr:ABC transporter permease [Acidobacteriaceae bacterium]MBV9500287.1 ABC transporter permease [Acidobacteriaceae bacterium]